MRKKLPILFAILAAFLYALSTPFSKLLLKEIPETLLAGLLYLGAGLGIALIYLFQKITKKEIKEKSLTKKDLPFLIIMVVLDILAPILLLLSLKYSSAASVSLLNNFEIVGTSLIALIIFKEKIPFKLWIGIILVTLSCVLLSIKIGENIAFSFSSLFAIGACLCWSLENNCTRSLSSKNPLQIVIIKGFASGIGALIIGLAIKERVTNGKLIFLPLLLGFFAYGLSILFYVYAQRYLGAAKTSFFYSVAPFIGILLSFIIFKEIPSYMFIIALVVMIIGMVFVLNNSMKANE